MTIEIPATGERVEARLIDEPTFSLAVRLEPSGRTTYVLAAMLKLGWRIVECTPAEREIMGAHGIMPDG